MVAKKQALDDAERVADDVSKKSNYAIDSRCDGETSDNLFKALREYHACLVSGEEKGKLMQYMLQLEMGCAGVY